MLTIAWSNHRSSMTVECEEREGSTSDCRESRDRALLSRWAFYADRPRCIVTYRFIRRNKYRQISLLQDTTTVVLVHHDVSFSDSGHRFSQTPRNRPVDPMPISLRILRGLAQYVHPCHHCKLRYRVSHTFGICSLVQARPAFYAVRPFDRYWISSISWSRTSSPLFYLSPVCKYFFS